MLDWKQCYSKFTECLYLYCAFVIDTVYTKWDFMRRYFIVILSCIYYVCFFNYMYQWFFMPHDDVIKWKLFPRYWPFMRGIHRSPVNSPQKGQWRGALMFSLICAWINRWINNGEAGYLIRYRPRYDVIVMSILVRNDENKDYQSNWHYRHFGNWNIFRVTGPWRGEFTGHRWIPRTKASDTELWCFLWSAPE